MARGITSRECVILTLCKPMDSFLAITDHPNLKASLSTSPDKRIAHVYFLLHSMTYPVVPLLR